MAYSKNQWTAGTPITAEKMMKIENELESLDNASSTAGNNIDALANEVETARDGAASLYSKIHTMDTSISNINASLATVALNSNNYMAKADYVSRIESIEDNVSDLQSDGNRYEAIENEVIAAHRNTVANDNLNQRFLDLEDAIDSNLDTRLDTLETVVGDNTSGLVKDVADNTSNLSSLTSRVGAAETAIGNKANATDVSGLATRVGSLETTVGNSNSGLVKAVADNADAIEVLQNKDTVVMTTAAFDALFNSEDELISTDNVALDADYIIGPNDDDQYLYYRIINIDNTYKRILISGGGISEGGGGTSSAVVCESYAAFDLITPKDVNTDYYVLQDGKYHHYRFDGTNVFEIGQVVDENALTNAITATVMGNVDNTISTATTTLSEKIKRYRLNKVTIENQGTYLDMYEFSYTDSIPESADDYPIEKQIHHILLPEGGGGGGSTSAAKMTLARRTPQNYYVLSSAEKIELSVFFSSYDEDQNEIYNGTYTLYRGSNIVDQGEILTDEGHLTDATGEFITKTFDIKKYCQTGVQTFRLVVSDGAGGNTQSREWRVELVSLYVETSFNDQTTYSANQKATISVTPYGSGGIAKTIVVKVDNATEGAGYITSTITTSGIPQEITIPAAILTAGAHLIEIYVEQVIGAGSEPTPSDSIYKDIVCINSSVTNPIISCIYRRDTNNDQEPVSVAQYTPLKIPYFVYDPTTNTPTVTIQKTINDNTISVTENLENSRGEYIFKGESEGTYTITITCRNTGITIPIVVNALGYRINPVTEGLVFDFNPVGLSNSSENREWKNSVSGFENIKFEVPEGATFDWYNGGYQIDKNNNTYFCIKAGSRMAINASLFDKAFFNNSNTGIEDNGAEFKCIFKTTNVKQGNAVFLTCQDGTKINVINYADDVTDVSKFTTYINAVEIYDNSQEDKPVLAVCDINNSDISTIVSRYGTNAASRTIETHTGVATLIFESASLRRYQVVENEVESCLYEEELTENGWLITRIKPVNEINQTSLGLEMKAHEVNITSKSGVLTTPYSEDDIIEFEYNINSKNNGAYILAYEDGVSTLPLLYYSTPNKDNFLHTTPGYIILGSDDCDLYIYRMKFYNKALTNQQILMNFYADASDGEEMVQRYERNTDLYNDPQSDSGVLAEITPQSVAAACPDLKVIMIETPHLTGGKKNFVKDTKIRCIHKNGRAEDNWVAFNGYHAGQGTSSDNYGMAGRNLDIMFGFNGVDTVIVPKDDNTYRFDSNYKSVLVTGITNNYDEIDDYNSLLTDLVSEYNSTHINTPIDINDLNGVNEIEGDTRHMYLNGTGKVGLSATSVPNNWFNIKVNIASSENANNALLQNRYNRYLPYKTPAMNRDSRIKNDMEFYNCVVFIKETGTPTEFTDDNGANRSWHFYAIGNIGDSKKTDDTRVNIPGDPNEFAVEISDNGLSNSGFSTGVYYANNEQTEITYTETNYGMKYPVTSEEWTNENNTAHSLLYNFQKKKGWEKSFEFRYDVTTKDGNTISESGAAGELADERQQNNKKVFADMYSWVVTATNAEFSNQLSNWFIEDSPLYWYLFTERYTMIDSRAKNTFYHYGKVYITTAEYNGSNIATLESELEALTEGTKEYAAKNTELQIAQFIYDHHDDFTVDNDKAAINNGYRFEMWDYDNDTALGINNNGKMVFSYGLEDTDKLPNGSWVYNEATSVIWRRIRENCYNKLANVYNKVNKDCWNAENLIEEFDAWQQQFPEELWRLDFERKYLRPYTVYNENKYLKDMANGRKKYQRRQFERDMAIYIYSKYNIGSAYEADDTIEFRTRAGSMNGLSLTVKPYGTMYLNIMFGNTETVQRKATAGETITIYPPETFNNADNTQIIIYNASRIQELGSLAGWQLDTMKFSKAIKLQKLILGADSPFSNSYSQNLTLANPILEELDIRNYTNMQPTLDLTKCQNLKILKSQGTNIQVVNFASNGLIEKAYLPSTTTGIYLRNLKHLNILSLDSYSNITAIESTGNNYNLYDCVLNTINNLTDINIDNIAWNGVTQAIMTRLYNIVGTSILKGIINMTGTVEEGALIGYRNKWPEGEDGLTINTNEANIQHQYLVTFKYDTDTIIADNISDEDSIIAQYYVTEINSDVGAYLRYNDNGTQKGLDPVALGWITTPTRNMTAQYTYTLGTYTNETYDSFSGWTYNGTRPTMSTSFKQNITLYTNFNRNDRLYNFKWYMDRNDPNSLVKISNNVIYGGGATESAPTLLELKKDNPNLVTFKSENNKYYIFKGWSHLPLNVTPENQNIYGEWEEYQIGSTSYGSSIDLSSLTPAQLLEVTHNSTQLAKIRTSDRMSIRLGYDGSDTTGRQILNENEYYRKIGRENYQSYSNEQLFLKDKAFTFVIDFKCDSNITSINPGGTSTATYESIIASCYEEDNARTHTYGFKLYYDLVNNCLRVGFGNTYGSTNRQNNTKIIGDNTTALERNIIVIRHPANSTSLYIYHGLGGSGMNNDVTEEIITDASFNATSFPLVFGACLDEQGGPIDDLTVKNMTYGYGTIYWAKVWDKDLGTGECKQLANWCHETATFGVVQTTNTNSILRVPNTNLLPRLYLSSLSASAMSGYRIEGINGSGSSTETIGWVNANYRRMLNQRIYNALPIQLQAIAYSAPYFSRHIKYEESTDQYNPGTWRLDDTSVDTIENDYISIPSYQEVSLEKVSIPLDVEANGALPWTSGSNATVWNYANNVFSPATDALSPTRYLTVRFKGAPISYTPNVYKLSKSAITSGSTAYSIITRNNTLNVGDIWEPIDDATGVMYIYVGRDEINNGVPIEYTTGTTDIKYCPAGGWVASVPWWTRSYSTNINSYSGINYIYVQTNGYPQVDSTSSNRYYIDYSIGF